MSSTVRYLAVDGEDAIVLDWFGRHDPAPRQVRTERNHVLYFRDLGPLAYDAKGEIDARASPVITLFPARQRRSILWTAGEVCFLATPLRERFPGLHRIRRQFVTWLSQFELVHDRPPGVWDDYLQGTIKHYDSRVYALPGASTALRRGTYFVGDDDNEVVLDRLCRALALRGVQCGRLDVE
jgi:hypothetical protein